jgi:hypothetical protein
MSSLSAVLRADKKIRWVDEDTILFPENTKDRDGMEDGESGYLVASLNRINCYFTGELRVAYAFSFWKGQGTTTIFPEIIEKRSGFKNLRLRATVASLNGPARDLIQAGAFDVEFECMDIAPMYIQGIVDIIVDSDECFRNGRVISLAHPSSTH